MRKFSVMPTVLSEGRIVKVCLPSITVYSFPDHFSTIVCYIIKNIYLKCVEIYKPPGEYGHLTWAKISAGWIVISDLKNPEIKIVQTIYSLQEAERAWNFEKEKTNQMASAIASTLVRAYSLPQAKRLVRSLLKHATTYYPNEKPLVKVTSQSMDDIMIYLDGIKVGLTKQEIFEYIKASACRQSNPRQAILDISNKLWEFIQERPSTWVTNHLNIIITEDIRVRNNLFVMSAAEGNIPKFNDYIVKEKINLLCLHSELNYTALHAAADFGQVKIIQRLLQTGISLDIKDPLRGQTALHFAADSGRVEVAKLLIDSGANRELANHEHMLPFQLAHKHGYIETREICKLLPPSVTEFQVSDIHIHTITLNWKAPQINLEIHSVIIEYEIEARFVEGAIDIPDPPIIKLSANEYCYHHLYPSCVYRFRIKCRSLSGWSEFGSWIFAKTLAHRAEAPNPVEIRKVSINGLVLTWFPPKRDNGHAIDYYQLEIADYHAIHGITPSNGVEMPYIELAPNEEEDADPSSPSQQQHDDDEYRVEFPPVRKSSASGMITKKIKRSSNAAAAAKKASLAASQGGVSKYYRLLKHKQLDLLLKYITGLEPHRLYQIRVRAHNELGYSPWSKWCEPIAPHTGVWLESILPQDNSMQLSWFKPLINPPRSIEFYELQLCVIQGTMVVNHPPIDQSTGNDEEDDDYHASHEKEDANKTKKKSSNNNITIGVIQLNDHSKPHHDINEFITLSMTIPTNQYFVQHLKAGRKYQFRVRAKLKEEIEWPNWEYCSVISDVIQMSSTVPDAPANLRPALQNQGKATSITVAVATNGEGSYEENEERFGDPDEVHYEINPVNIQHEKLIEDVNKYYNTSSEPASATAGTQNKSHNKKAPPPSTETMAIAPPDLLTYQDSNNNSSENSLAGHNSTYPSELSIANSLHTEYLVPKTSIDIQQDNQFDITHNTITLTFTNGDSNGERIIGHELQIVRIRNYHFNDLLYAKEAFLGIQEDEDENDEDLHGPEEGERASSSKKPLNYTQRMEENLNKPFATSDGTVVTSKSQHSTQSSLAWETIYLSDECNEEIKKEEIEGGYSTIHLPSNITLSRFPVEVIGQHTYRVHNLTPGETYAFRIRSKNKIGWSAYSHSTPLIATYPSIPPDKPILIYRQQTVVILMWKDKETHNKQQSKSSAMTPLTSPKLIRSGTSKNKLLNSPSTKNLQPPPVSTSSVSLDYNTNDGFAENVPAPIVTTLSTLEYQLQIRKVSIRQSFQPHYAEGTDSKSLLLEYLSNWETIHSQVFTYEQLKKQPIYKQFIRPITNTTSLPLANNSQLFLTSKTASYPNLSTLLSSPSNGGFLDEAADVSSTSSTLRFVVISNLVEYNWYIMRIRIRTVIGWSPWSSPSDPFRMAK